MYAAPALRLCVRAAAYIGLALVPFLLRPGIWIDHQSMLPAVLRGCELGCELARPGISSVVHGIWIVWIRQAWSRHVWSRHAFRVLQTD